MYEKIRLVEGDDLPIIKLTLKNPDASVIDLTGADVKVYFRETGSSTLLATILCDKPGGGIDGIATFNVPLRSLNIKQGYYEGEVEIDFGGSTQTVYDTLQFQVRAQFS